MNAWARHIAKSAALNGRHGAVAKIRFESLKSEIAFIIEDAIRMLRIKREMRFQEMLIPPIPLYKKLQLHRIYKKLFANINRWSGKRSTP